jgi:lipocalin-like protein
MRPIVAGAMALAVLAWGGRLSAQAPLGTWQLLSRTDSSAAGVQPADGPLGADPIAWIIYDTRGHVAAQLMARDRTKPAVSTPTVSPPDPNNSAASGGYDAYFGTYEVDAARHTVTHHLLAALSPGDVGRTLRRSFFLRGDTLIIAFDTRRVDGTSVTRRVVWRRIAP